LPNELGEAVWFSLKALAHLSDLIDLLSWQCRQGVDLLLLGDPASFHPGEGELSSGAMFLERLAGLFLAR
jgi:hypothetical protein